MTSPSKPRPARQPRRVGSYAVAIQWIADNDDTEWLYEADGTESVTLALVADVFGRTVEEAKQDLRSRLERTWKKVE